MQETRRGEMSSDEADKGEGETVRELPDAGFQEIYQWELRQR